MIIPVEITAELHAQRKQLVDYLLSKVKSQDFHAVQDAASDIREIDSKLELIQELQL